MEGDGSGGARPPKYRPLNLIEVQTCGTGRARRGALKMHAPGRGSHFSSLIPSRNVGVRESAGSGAEGRATKEAGYFGREGTALSRY